MRPFVTFCDRALSQAIKLLVVPLSLIVAARSPISSRLHRHVRSMRKMCLVHTKLALEPPAAKPSLSMLFVRV